MKCSSFKGKYCDKLEGFRKLIYKQVLVKVGYVHITASARLKNEFLSGIRKAQ